MTVIAYFDGLCEPAYPGGKRNPGGCACAGWVVELAEGTAIAERITGHKHVCTGDGASNNRAEYEAALECLRVIYRTGYRGPVELRGDSQLVVRQFSGDYGCHAPHLQALLATLHKATLCFASVKLVWVPREQNEEADKQSRLAYEAERGRR